MPIFQKSQNLLLFLFPDVWECLLERSRAGTEGLGSAQLNLGYKRPCSYSVCVDVSSSNQHVSASVKGQVVWARKAPVTVCTFKGFHSGVLAIMPRQLIRASKFPCASLPRAFVWLFTCMGPPMCFQVGALCVHFIAAFKVTPVYAPLLRVRGLWPPLAPCAFNTEWWDGILHSSCYRESSGSRFINTVQGHIWQVIIITVAFDLSWRQVVWVYLCFDLVSAFLQQR